ncbi:hypothetical protein PGB90_002193 [Kerria lacca]
MDEKKNTKLENLRMFGEEVYILPLNHRCMFMYKKKNVQNGTQKVKEVYLLVILKASRITVYTKKN